MDTPTPQDTPAAPDPRGMGVVTKMLSRVLGHMPAADRTALMQDAAAMTTAELGKADEQLAAAKGDGSHAVDSAHTGWIEDHWSDTRTNEIPPVTHVHGPGSSVPSGSFNVGPSQQAAGNGAIKMEREYSRYAPQHGITVYAEQLGRDLVAVKSALRSLMGAMHGITAQLDVVKATLVTPAPLPDEAVMLKLIDTAVGKAVGEAVSKAVSKVLAVKAKDEKDDKGDDEEAKSAALTAKADEKKTKEEEDEEDKPFGKADLAAELRVMAKSRVDHARLRVSKALDYIAEGKPKAAQRAMGLARVNVAKAQELVDEVKALCDGHAGLNTQVVSRMIAKAEKGIADSIAENQDIWPTATETEFGKADAVPAAAAAPATNPDLAKAIAQVEAAATGMGMLQANVSELMQALTAKNTMSATIDGEQTKLPPVFALAKAGASDLSSREIELARLRDSNVITFDDFDRARDTLMRVRMNMPPDTIQAMVDRLPDAAKAVLTRGAA